MKRIELLAPAGGMKQFIAAVNNGADAIYIGGPLFNARLNATNFTMEEIKEATSFGHLRNVKTYVTMNTLLYNEELNEALNYAKELYTLGVDALIIQDLGLGKLIKEHIPDFEIHLSTQATVYNREGVIAAKKLGYKRVVLSRELSHDEIKSCIDKDLPEIEVFVHGALCMCYSGQCQLSRFIGGRSGNRGLCAQPCRLEYEIDGDPSHPLSPKDLCLIDELGTLIDLGVSSLKIEGRMKSPEYVSTVVRIYRKYIDLYYKNHSYTVSKEDREDLKQIFNRGGFTKGYFFDNPKEDLLSGLSPKNQGIPIGTVLKSKGLYLYAKLNREITMGDVIELDKSHESFQVTYLKKEKDYYILGDLKGEPYIGEGINRIVSKDLNERARATFENEKNNKKMNITMSLFGYIGNPLKLSAKSGKYSVSKVLDNYIVEPAKNKVTSINDIKDKLTKTGDTPFNVEKLNINVDDNIFIPLSNLNELRRNVLDELKSTILDSYKKEPLPKEELNIDPFMSTLSLKDMDRTDIVIFPQVTKGFFDNFLRDNLNKYKDLNVLIHNISWIEPLKNIGATVYGGYGLNILNSESLKAYQSLGLSNIYMASLEAYDKESLKDVPLMVTEHPMKSGIMKDRKGKKYIVECNEETSKTYIFSE